AVDDEGHGAAPADGDVVRIQEVAGRRLRLRSAELDHDVLGCARVVLTLALVLVVVRPGGRRERLGQGQPGDDEEGESSILHITAPLQRRRHLHWPSAEDFHRDRDPGGGAHAGPPRKGAVTVYVFPVRPRYRRGGARVKIVYGRETSPPSRTTTRPSL